MTSPKPPLIVDTGSELLLFSSLRRAEGYLEPIDLENREYPAAYDSRGQLLELGIEKVPTSRLFGLLQGTAEHVWIRAALDNQDHAAELAAKVREYLTRLGVPASPAEVPLHALLEQLRERAGFVL